MAQGSLPWQPIKGSNLAKSDYSPLFVAMISRNVLQYRQSDFKKFICDDLATLCVNVVNIMSSNSYEGERCTPRRFFL